MRPVRVIAGGVLIAAAVLAGPAPTANSANPVGNGHCDTPYPASGEFCIGKTDAGAPWADWTGDNVINVFNDWRYSGYPSDSPNDDGESWINGDSDAQYVYEDPNRNGPRSCFPAFMLTGVDSDMKGRESNDSSLQPRTVGYC